MTHIRIIFAIVIRTVMNNTNNHSNVCVIIMWKRLWYHRLRHLGTTGTK
jgi:hypothetical protein